VREPNGVLFEIATDGPGFGIDEDISTLGEQLVLPPFLESHRRQIVANLEKLDLASSVVGSKHAFFDIIDIEEKLHLALRLAELGDISLEILLCALR